MADMYHDKVITKVRSNLDSTMVAAVHGQPHRELNGIKGAKSARGVCRVNTPSHVRYADGCTHRKCGWSSCSIGVVVSSMRLRKRNSRSVLRASARLQCRTS